MPRRRQRQKNGPVRQEAESTGMKESLQYVIKKSDALGRYLVAAEDLGEGCVVISEDALVVGPAQDTPPVCLGCYTTVSDTATSYSCHKCHWPLCSKKCKGLHKKFGHSIEECSVLENCKLTSDRLAHTELYNAIVPIRCLLLKDRNPEMWEILLTMEAHNNVRRNIPSIWDHNKKTVVDRIRNEWNICKYSEEEIHTMCGILEVNAFAVGDDSLNIRGLYPTAFLIAHSCVPNTSHTDDDDYHIQIFSSTPISKGEMIVLSYTNSLQGTQKRREHLKQCKFFECKCARCVDPTELGTYLSAMKCKECNTGHLLPTDPLTADSAWLCDNKLCHATQPACNVDTLINRWTIIFLSHLYSYWIGEKIKDVNHSNILELENSIKCHGNLLHKNHYYILGMKYSLSQLYGKSKGFLIHEMNEKMLAQKQQICEDILQIFDNLEPGLSHARGLTMYELHAPVMILTIQKFELGKLSKIELCRKLRQVVSYLRECCKIFKYNAKNSQEGCLKTAAEEALKQLKSWEPVVGKLQD